MKSFSLALGLAALVAIVAGCSGSNGGSQLPSPGAMQLTAYHGSASSIHMDSGPGRSKWWMYYVGPYGTCPASQYCRSHTNQLPSGGPIQFYFIPNRYSALLMTGMPSLTGNLTNFTLNDNVAVTTSGKHTPYGVFEADGGNYCGATLVEPTVRFYFSSGGLFAYTHYWWSNPESWTLAKGSATISQVVNDPSEWSDWAGQTGSSLPTQFANAMAHVRWVGLSFGGGCFFSNGVTVTGPKRAIFNSSFTETD